MRCGDTERPYGPSGASQLESYPATQFFHSPIFPAADWLIAIESRFCALASIPAGRYALVDYVNFKGEGTKPEERYAGEGWGLKQVLEEMHGTSPANVDFAQAAVRVLERRVANAPPVRREQRWLPGWRRRVDSYRWD